MTRPIQVAVLGAGSWGTTVASLAAANTPTVIWSRKPQTADEINLAHRNSAYLGELPLHPALRATDSLEEAVSGALGVPFPVFEKEWRKAMAERPVPPLLDTVHTPDDLRRLRALRDTELKVAAAPFLVLAELFGQVDQHPGAIDIVPGADRVERVRGDEILVADRRRIVVPPAL